MARLRRRGKPRESPWHGNLATTSAEWRCRFRDRLEAVRALLDEEPHASDEAVRGCAVGEDDGVVAPVSVAANKLRLLGLRADVIGAPREALASSGGGGGVGGVHMPFFSFGGGHQPHGTCRRSATWCPCRAALLQGLAGSLGVAPPDDEPAAAPPVAEPHPAEPLCGAHATRCAPCCPQTDVMCVHAHLHVCALLLPRLAHCSPFQLEAARSAAWRAR